MTTDKHQPLLTEQTEAPAPEESVQPDAIAITGTTAGTVSAKRWALSRATADVSGRRLRLTPPRPDALL
jgi:hypothetical protein